MLKTRLIAVIIVRDGKVVQSENFKHTNVIHYDAFHIIEALNNWSVDEIIILNVSKNKSSKEEFLKLVSNVSKTCFIPISAGGFVDSIEYGSSLIFSGADKLVINTLWKTNISVVKSLSEKFGRQCIIASIDVKKNENSQKKEVYINRGMDNISIDPVKWSMFCESSGAGEIFFNNIDHDGARKGYDLESIKKISKSIKIPLIAFGGVFQWKDLLEGINAGADAVSAANIFHYKEMATKLAKKYLIKNNIMIRN